MGLFAFGRCNHACNNGFAPYYKDVAVAHESRWHIVLRESHSDKITLVTIVDTPLFVDADYMADLAVMTLMDRMEEPDGKPRIITIEGDLVIKDSVKRI